MKEIGTYFTKHKTQLLPLFILLFLAAATILTMMLSQRKQDTRSRAVQPDNGQLTFNSPQPALVSNQPPNNTFTISLNMISTTQAVTGSDVIVSFDNSKLTLTGVTKGTSSIYKTYAPVDTNDDFDTTRVMSCANTGSSGGSTANCPSNIGNVEFGFVAFDWTTNALPSPATNSTYLSAATLTFQVKTTAPSGTTTLSFVNNGITSTTDSNIVVIPTSGGDPEDILQAAPYTGSSATVTIGTTASPAPTPTPTPTSTPRPSATPSVLPSASPSTVCKADINKDGPVNIFDYGILKQWYFTTCSGAPGIPPSYNACNSDLNSDGTVNIFDYGILKGLYFQVCAQ